jgi:hypothetical protein
VKLYISREEVLAALKASLPATLLQGQEITDVDINEYRSDGYCRIEFESANRVKAVEAIEAATRG